MANASSSARPISPAPMSPTKKLVRALNAEIDEAAWSSLYSTASRPFPKPASEKIAVKVINRYRG
jgi:adenine-specific DNA-methyltransferase